MCETTLTVGDLERQLPGMFGSLNNHNELSAEKSHGGFRKRFETRSVAIANSTESTRTLNFERQLIGGIGDEGAVFIDQRDGDKSQILTISL